MQNRYNDQEAAQFVATHANFPPEMGLRVYTSRLLGAEEDLVLHGGGNTSAKAKITNLLGEEMEVIYVKGSGWDLGNIEPAGLPGLDLGYLRRLRALEDLSDKEMVNQFRTHLLDASSPNPSIETLVHAFLPQPFIDHTHADAIVTLTNQPRPEELLREALGDKIGILPFIMPGFPLAQAVIDLWEREPEMEALILRNHGIFTFGPDAKTSYNRMIDYVTRAEEFIARRRRGAASPPPPELSKGDPELILPLLRGALTLAGEEDGQQQTCHLLLDDEPQIRELIDRADAKDIYLNGVLTPDHVIRTKNYPLFLDLAGAEDEKGAREIIHQAVAAYGQAYNDYFKGQEANDPAGRTRLDPHPRVILVKGLGLVTAGKSRKEASICADIARHTLSAKTAAAEIGTYEELDETHIFAMEYWSLEQAKLGRGQQPASLAGKIALVTGGGGAIAMGIARQLLTHGAQVFLTDIDEGRLAKAGDILAAQFGPMVGAIPMDVSDGESVREGFSQLIRQAGGLDILVPNAGVAHVEGLAELKRQDLDRVLAVNFSGTFEVIQAAIPIFRRQGHGGHIVINSSKNVFAPGASFGAYSSSKAGAHQLGKVAALELAEIGVRVNMINADAIFSDGEVSSGLWDVVGPDRMRSRNLDPQGLAEYYRQRNLLKTEVTADDVGRGVLFFASNQTPTTGATLPIDGGIMAAFPR
ncbi:MAG: bifunctional aldolase/short-chain dehydrogenase [Thermodesulfobacteriota bacterium]